MTYKGKFTPRNPKKYAGDPTNIIYRSSWEAKAFRFFDTNSNVLSWQSEEIGIPYMSPIDNRIHRYYPDIIATIRQKDGTTKTVIFEIKPKHQTREPVRTSQKLTRKYLNEVATWGINEAKWQAAKSYAENRGWEFQILTEEQIFGKSDK